MRSRTSPSVAAIAWLLFAAACSRAPEEPQREPPSKATVTPLPFVLDAPAQWTQGDVKGNAALKAAWRVPPAGNDKEEADVTVHYYGPGKKGDVDEQLAAWFDQFDGDPAKLALRSEGDAPAGKVRWVEFGGSYRGAFGPKVGPKKQPAVSIIKSNWRMVGAVLLRSEGNYFFRILGPEDTVQSAKSAFKRMVETLQPRS